MALSSSIFVLSFGVLKLDWKDQLRSRENNNRVLMIYITIYTSWIFQADKERALSSRAALNWFSFKLLPYHEAGGRDSRLIGNFLPKEGTMLSLPNAQEFQNYGLHRQAYAYYIALIVSQRAILKLQ